MLIAPTGVTRPVRPSALPVRRQPNPGTTVVELVVALVVLAVLGAAVGGLVVHQARFYARVVARGQGALTMRHALTIVAGELRSVAPADGDLHALTARTVDFRALEGEGIVCTIDGARSAITTPPASGRSFALAAWATAPVSGDTLLVYDAGGDPGAGDGAWRVHVLTASAVPGAPCPSSSGFTSSGAESATGWRLHFAPPLSPTIGTGAPLRIVRRRRYVVYRASDGRWYLGGSDCRSGRAIVCSTVQPVAGPFAPDGFEFAARDSAGVPAADLARVHEIALTARAFLSGDSLTVTVVPGNR